MKPYHFIHWRLQWINICKGGAVFATTVITLTPACKNLFWCIVYCLPGVMCAIELCDVMLITDSWGSRDCVWLWKMIGMPHHKFMVRSLYRLHSAPTSLFVTLHQCNCLRIDQKFLLTWSLLFPPSDVYKSSSTGAPHPGVELRGWPW